MSDSSMQWWARIKYVEEFLDSVPVSQISECDENWKRSVPFQPKHLTDFVLTKIYIVQTDKFNGSEDDEPKMLYAMIGNLAVSEESLKNSKKKIKWPDMSENNLKSGVPCEICAEIMAAGSENIKKRRKTSKSCCILGGSKPQPLFSLVSELKTAVIDLELSMQQQYALVTDQIKKLKKRLYTDICVYNPRFDDPYGPILRSTIMNCFKPIEKSNHRMRLKSLAIIDAVKDMHGEIEFWHSLKTPMPSLLIVFIQVHVDLLRRIEMAMSSLNESFDNLMVQIVEMEERLMDHFIDVHNIVNDEHEQVHIPESPNDSTDDSDVTVLFSSSESESE